MDKDKLTNMLRQASQEVDVGLNASQIELFCLYLRELLEWNRKFNLTAVKNTEDMIIKHFVDSLTPLPYLPFGGLLDIGSGAGFPGIPLKIAAPRLQVKLVDASRKKVSFLKHIIRTLGLTDVTAVQSRIENMDRPEPSFQILISRAFRRLEDLLQVVSPLLRPGNTLVAMLGPTGEEERTKLRGLACTEGLELNQTIVLDLPYGRGKRTLLFFNKN
ncbi:MAG: 16S rRNA (guanine(527)-N(7))-methyltransferase RsmG [Deltaproteobacteria bacterium]|nr:MAG: 16S rRNA (guanine(527)-N(7))-methyltransferase RsmG [Deltaproteobacteria bacterium]